MYTFISSADFLSEDTFTESYQALQATLEAHRSQGMLSAFDGLQLFYEYFLVENAVGNVVIVHGLSEFTKKFYEVAFFFLKRGYNVFLYDQRGHGYSERETSAPQALLVKSYDDYVKDLESFVDTVVERVSPLPLCFYSHSMGGAVVGLYMQRHPEKAKKAIFSSPMIRPCTDGVSTFLVKLVADVHGLFLGKDKPFLKSPPFSTKSSFENSSALSRARFELYMQQRIEEPCYQTSQVTNGWMSQTMRVTKRLLHKGRCKKIKTPCLLFSAGRDEIVMNEPQKLFSERLPDCRFVDVPEAKHTVFASNEKIMRAYFQEIDDFLKE